MTISYADGIREARDWVVECVRDPSPSDDSFVGWYAYNALQYTVETAWDFYWGHAGAAVLELREGEGEMSSAELLGQRVLHPAYGQGRETVPAPHNPSLYQGVTIWA